MMKSYYLDYTIKHQRLMFIKTKTLKRDVLRGVKRLSEESYSNNYGSTLSSMNFIKALRNHINLSKVYRAELKFDNKKWYRLFLYTSDGYTIVLRGVSGGYHGQGTRGCHDVLSYCGFNERQCAKVFKKESFKVIKRKVS